MHLYIEYLKEIEKRKKQNLSPKPIDSAMLTKDIIFCLQDPQSKYKKDATHFFMYNILPGTTPAAIEKAKFLKAVILEECITSGFSSDMAFELLSHMKGGPSIQVLLDLALGEKHVLSKKAAEILKTQVFLYDSDLKRLKKALSQKNPIARDVLESYSRAEFFTNLPDIPEKIDVVTYVAAEGDISTDLLSPGSQAHSRSDRELHGKCMISKAAQDQIQILKKKYPHKQVMIVAEKGTMGVGSSRMSGVNNVALWTGKPVSPYIPFVNHCPIVGGTNGISPIFLTTVDVTGGIGIDLKNWVKKTDSEGRTILNQKGEPVFEQLYSVKTGTCFTIHTKEKKLYSGNRALIDISSSLTPQKCESIKAGGSYAVVFGKKLQVFAADALGIKCPQVFSESKQVYNKGQGLTAVEKIFNHHAIGLEKQQTLHAGSDVKVIVKIVGSQDTTGLMTSQELESMAATMIAPSLDAAYQSGCHTASVWDKKAQANIPKLMTFMSHFGLITARDPNDRYPAMTDVIHKVLNDLTVDDWAIIIGGDSHTRMSRGVAFGADSGTVALALATGEASMPIPESVKVTFKGDLKPHMDFRDVVHATQAQMLQTFGENVFQGKVIEVHLGSVMADQAFTFTDWTAEMKAKASICISDDMTLISSLKISKRRIQLMIDNGMDNQNEVLKRLILKADKRIAELESGTKLALKPDPQAKYSAEFVVDLDQITEPMIADPDVNNTDISKRYTHDTIRAISYYKGNKKVDLGFVGSCMIHKGDLKILSQMLKNIEKQKGKVVFKSPLVVAAPTYNMIDELKSEGDWQVLQRYSGFEFDDNHPKRFARITYENKMYLERPGCNLCMGNQEKAGKGDTVMATSTRLFHGRVVEDSDSKKGESLLASTPVVVLSAILGRTPSMNEYKQAVQGITLAQFSPPL